MPAFLSNHFHETVKLSSSNSAPYDPPRQKSQEKSASQIFNTWGPPVNGHTTEGSGASKRIINSVFLNGSNGINSSLQSLPNGRSSDSADGRERVQSRNGGGFPVTSIRPSSRDNGKHLPIAVDGAAKLDPPKQEPLPNGDVIKHSGPQSRSVPQSEAVKLSGHSRNHSSSAPQNPHFITPSSTYETTSGTQKLPPPHRFSSPPQLSNLNATLFTSSTSSLPSTSSHLQNRHTLQVPKVSSSRTSRELSSPTVSTSGEPAGENERSQPVAHSTGRTSLNLVRRQTRSIQSDPYLDEISPDEDTARWTENIRQKRASRRQRKEEEEEDDRVVVGTKVDMNHVNWVTAYNMLTGIRFTVSRTNAKMNRDLADSDFDAKHKFSFDITGNELTPSAKYDFKFKDYAPWVFRHLRARFRLDPADYLMSLTSKYILSELGSPGKSGSFFYFSRDYKYIIKTIHHAEHKLLRRILRDYYVHIDQNPNTLISQFYGLHRVKIPYGRKIHFVVMNNLFPPHRDIHQTFDLKGSTIGRDFKEDNLEQNSRTTLKDLNWLRRNYHFEFGPAKKRVFVEQMKRDVALLQRLKIMDYSLLVGIHDMSKGNEENLRDKTLQVFQPGGDHNQEDPQSTVLLRTPSKLENARKAKQLRQIIKREKPVPMDKSNNMLPDEILEERKDFIFYSDDGGFRATHDDDSPGEEIYYLGIIDCLTNYGLVKKAEHLWKGLSNDKTQISPIPPEGYGDRFVKFIVGLTMTREESEREMQSSEVPDGFLGISRQQTRNSTERIINKAEHQAAKTLDKGVVEDATRDRTLTTAQAQPLDKVGATLPVVEEDGEGGSREESVRDEKVGMVLAAQQRINASAEA